MSEHKKRIQNLKRPDAFQKKFFHYLDWCRKHPDIIVKIAIPVVLLISIAIAWLYLLDHNREKRNAELAQIDSIYEDESKKADDKRREISKEIAKLQEDKDKKSENESKVKELEASLKAIKADRKDSLPKYLDYLKSYSSYSEGWRAGMNAVNIYLENADYKKAEEILADILAKADKNDFYQIQVRALYISVLEELSEFDKAAEQADLLLKSADEEQLPRALFVKGRVQLLSGKKDAAFETFDKVINEHNASTEAQKAKAIKALF